MLPRIKPKYLVELAFYLLLVIGVIRYYLLGEINETETELVLFSTVSIFYLFGSYWLIHSERSIKATILKVLYGVVLFGLTFVIVFHLLFLDGASQMMLVSWTLFFLVFIIDLVLMKFGALVMDKFLILRVLYFGIASLAFLIVGDLSLVEYRFRKDPDFIQYLRKNESKKPVSDLIQSYNKLEDIPYSEIMDYYNNGEYSEAIQGINILLKSDSSNAKYYNDIGACYLQLDSLHLGIEYLNMAKKVDSTYGKAYTNLGITYTDMDSFNLALPNFNKAFKYDSITYKLLNYRGTCLSKLGFDSLAIEDYSKAIRLDSTSGKAYRNRSTCYDKLGRLEKALEDLEIAIRLEPDNPKGYSYRGRVYRLNLIQDKAIIDLKKAIQLDVDNYENYLYLGNTFYDSGRYELALNYYDTAQLKSPDDLAIIYYWQGQANFALENYQLSYEQFSKAESLNPDEDNIKNMLNRTMKILGISNL